MQFLTKYWISLKKDIIPLLYLSAVQVWWCFNFPLFTKLETPWSMLASTIMSLATIALCFYMFANPAHYASVFNYEHVNAPEWFKDALKISRIVMFNVVFFFMWYKDFYGMSNFHYLFCYVHCLLVFLLLAKAVNRQQQVYDK